MEHELIAEEPGLHELLTEHVYWKRDEGELRAYLLATNKAIDAWFEERWNEAVEQAAEIFDPDQHDEYLPNELFHEAYGIWPASYYRQLSGSVLKDSITLYELFLERLANTVLRRFGAGLSTAETDDSWRWPDCVLFYRHYLGIEVASPEIEAIRWMRNKLAHLHGSLRTRQGKVQFEQHLDALALNAPSSAEESEMGLVDQRPHFPRGIYLTPVQTWRVLNLVANQVEATTGAAFPFTAGRTSTSHLEAVRSRSPVPVKDFGHKKLIVWGD